VDEKLNRSDIRSDPSDGSVKQGVPLRLVFHVSQIDSSSCTPLTGATVDIWHCDALGVYSDVTDKGQRTQKNDRDGIFRGGGEQLMLKLAKDPQGYVGTFDIGLQIT
jgi:protocatechuate 3,4-dioxygenase beta subunit